MIFVRVKNKKRKLLKDKKLFLIFFYFSVDKVFQLFAYPFAIRKEIKNHILYIVFSV